MVNDRVYVNTSTELSLSREKAKTTDQVDECAKKLENLDLKTTTSGENNTLTYWAVKILNTADPWEKANLTVKVGKQWFDNELDRIGHIQPPDQPARLDSLNIVEPGKIRRGKGGTQGSRIALIHSLANIEQWAIDLSWDIVARYADTKFPDGSQLPREFFSDFVKVAMDEAKVQQNISSFFNSI